MDLSYLINGKGLLDKPAILIETYEILYVFIAREIFKKTSDGRFSGNIIGRAVSTITRLNQSVCQENTTKATMTSSTGPTIYER